MLTRIPNVHTLAARNRRGLFRGQEAGRGGLLSAGREDDVLRQAFVRLLVSIRIKPRVLHAHHRLVLCPSALSFLSQRIASRASLRSFIYGGDSFGLFPPRVNNGYGSGVEELLSNGIISKVADAAPGLIKVALRPPVSVDAVAGAAAKAAVGAVSGSLDGTLAINAAAGQPAATGLSDAMAAAKEKFSELTAAK